MAGTRTVLADQTQVNSRTAAFGLLPSKEADSSKKAAPEEKAKGDAESEEDEKSDASANATDADSEDTADDVESSEDEGEESTDDEAETKADEKQEDKESGQIAKFEKTIERLEKENRAWQSRHDTVLARIERFDRELKAATEQVARGGEDPLASLGDEDVVTGKDLKKAKQTDAQKRATERAAAESEAEKLRYVRAHPDYTVVIEHMNKNRLHEDPDMKTIPTDAVGVYFALLANKQGGEIEALKREVKDAAAAAEAKVRKEFSRKGRKGVIPPTGGDGAGRLRKGGSNRVEPVSIVEKQWASFMGKYGYDGRPTIVK